MTAATAATAATASTAATAASRSWRLQDALAAAAPERVGQVSSVVGLGLDVHGLDAAIGDSVRIGDAAPVHAEVVAADWTGSQWKVRTADGRSFSADVLVPAVGQLSNPVVPDVPGEFAGPSFHSAEWPDIDLRGKRVAVVGTGASAIQFVPGIVDDVAAMTVFQRSAASATVASVSWASPGETSIETRPSTWSVASYTGRMILQASRTSSVVITRTAWSRSVPTAARSRICAS